MSEFDDIEGLLADILDDTKPLPTASQTVMNVVANSGPESLVRAAEVAYSDPETFLEGLMTEEPVKPTPQMVAAKTELMGEAVLADIEQVTQRVTLDAVEGDVVVANTIFTDSAQRDAGAAIQPMAMPTFTAEDFASTMDIRNFATLVTLNTARWHAKTKDRQASKDAAKANDADERSFETRKNLLVGADGPLKAVHKAIDEARVAHYEMTLPWSTTSMHDVGRRTGGRLLPNTLFVQYTTVMAEKRQAMKTALNAFLPQYPQMIEEAKKKLGKRFDAREYPNPSSIAQHFDLSFDFQPIPKGDDFAGLPQAQLDALAAKVNENTRIMAENAMQDLWKRLHESVGRMSERLNSPDKLFHDTLVQNVRDIARLLSHLNVTSDAKIERLRQRVESDLCGADPKALRKDAALRSKIGAAAADIIREMGV